MTTAKRRYYRLAPEEIERIRELRAEGMKGADVARTIGCSASRIFQLTPGVNVRMTAAAERRAERQRRRQEREREREHRITRIRALRADGHSQAYVARVVGCRTDTVHRYAPGHVGKVPVAPLHEAFLASPMTAADVAREIGWWCTNNHGTAADCSRVKRTLGLTIDTNGHGRRSHRTLVDAETVALIAEAIGVAPWSVMPDDDRPAWMDAA